MSMGAAEPLLQRLENVRQTGHESWMARCPAHADKTASLSIKAGNKCLLVYCFGGCEPGDVLGAVGMTVAETFYDYGKDVIKPQNPKRYGQAMDALSGIALELILVSQCAEQMAAGFALDTDQIKRLRVAYSRIKAAVRIAT